MTRAESPSHLSANIPVAPNVSYAYMTRTGDKRRVENVTVDQGMGNETMSYDSEGRLSQVIQTFTGRESYPMCHRLSLGFARPAQGEHLSTAVWRRRNPQEGRAGL